jgi:hypothetical protein
MVDTSDKRDVQFVDAAKQLSAVPQVTAPGMFASFDPKPYESALAQLLTIQDELSLAKVRRVMGEAQGRLPDIDAEIAKAKVSTNARVWLFPQHHAGQVNDAKSHADAAGAVVKEIDKSLSQNLTDSETHKGEVTQGMKAELDSRRAQIDDINKSQPKRWQYPSPCALH